jgi:hypothetical protein
VNIENYFSICVEITVKNDQVLVIITKEKDGNLLNRNDQPIEIQEIINKIVQKYISGFTPRAVSSKSHRYWKCVTLTNDDVICVEAIEHVNKTIIKSMKNNNVIDESETSEIASEVVDQTLMKHIKTPQGKLLPITKMKKCRVLNGGETVCVDVAKEGEFVTLNTTKDNEVVNSTTTATGNMEDVLDNEFRRYINRLAIEQSVVKQNSKCIMKSNRETICAKIVNENNKLTSTVMKNGVIIDSQETRGNMSQALEDVLNKYVNKTASPVTVQSKSNSKCGGSPNGDQYCVEISEENKTYHVTVRKNGVVTKSFITDTSKEMSKVLDIEFDKYLTLLLTASETRVTATKHRCKRQWSGNKICVKVTEIDDVKTVETSKNDIWLWTTKSKDSFEEIFKKEFEAFQL